MGLNSKISWIINGRLTHVLPVRLGPDQTETDLLERSGYIRLTESSDGVEIKWSVFAANWSSLYFLMEWVYTQTGPFKLVYFLSGWFTEEFRTSEAAAARLAEVLAKSDMHISSHTYVRPIDPTNSRVPHILRETLDDHAAIPDISVDCAYDEFSNRFVVERVGPNSNIAKLYGMSPVSFPCLSGHSYDQVVSEAYNKVMKDELPIYDHVLAAMEMPQKEVVWLPYQRVILPHRFPDGRKGVSVTTEVTDVDIKII